MTTPATHLHPDVLYVYAADDLTEVTSLLAVLYDATQTPQPVWPAFTWYDRATQPYALVLAQN